MANLARFTSPLWDLDTFHIFDDFEADQSDLFWVDTIPDTGSAAVGDAARGIMALTPSDGSVADNDEVYLACANEVFILAASRPLYARARLQYSEANVDDANVFFGFASAVAANLLVDDGAGPRASGNIICIEKRDGETVWRLTSRNGAVVNSSLSTKTAGGANFQTLEVIVQDFDATNMQVVAKVDGEYLKDSNMQTLKHFIAIASATEMQVAAGIKNGGANLEVLNLDYIYAHQLR
jgi:hypothetical protein